MKETSRRRCHRKIRIKCAFLLIETLLIIFQGNVKSKSLGLSVHVLLLTQLNVAWSWTVLPDMTLPDKTHPRAMEGKFPNKAVMTVLGKPVK